VVPADSDRVSRARPYSGTCQGRSHVFVYGTLTLCGVTFQSLRLTHDFVTSRPAGRRIEAGPSTPRRQRLPPITSSRFGLIPFRSPLLRESRFLSFPPVTKMFQFTGLPPPALFDSGRGTRALPRVGCPIRRSRDQRSVSTSPGLIAAAHVLHRLLAPRHPPCALVLLIRKNTRMCRYGVFKVRADPRPPSFTEKNRPREAVSQNSTAYVIAEVDVVLGEPGHRTTQRSSTGLAPTGVQELRIP
jgi:hypothetical protein